MGTFDNINRIYECLMDEETKYILKDYYSKEVLSDKLGELVNV